MSQLSGAECYRAVRERGGFADLSRRARFRISGADRVRWLNGQVSNDVRKITPDAAIYACVMTAKGKMCADVFISDHGDSLLIDAAPALRDSLGPRLERYIIADDVTLEDETEKTAQFHILAPASRPQGSVYANRFGIEGWDVICPAPEAEQCADDFSKIMPVVDAATLETLRIEHGIPAWGMELDEDILPPEAGLDRTAVDYHKGCYLGQEVISRIKSVGHVNKQLTGFILDTLIPPGAQLFDPEARDRAVGRITSTAQSFALSRPIALGYLKRGTLTRALVAQQAGAPETRAEVHPLPFVP